jgi:hypothetical protein
VRRGTAAYDAEQPDALVFKSGSSTILVYQSQYAGSNQATALKAKGVVFGRYDLPGTTRVGDVHVSATTRSARRARRRDLVAT